MDKYTDEEEVRVGHWARSFPGTDKNLMRRGPKSGVEHPTEQSELHTREQKTVTGMRAEAEMKADSGTNVGW